MSTTFVLIRHGLHVFGPGRIAGRTPGVHLSPDGVEQAERLPGRLASIPVDAIYCSPMERTVETAQPLSRERRLELLLCDELVEIDYGTWTGETIDHLRTVERWAHWNSFRSGHRAPGGESMLQVQTRAVELLSELRERHSGGCVVLVSHGDVIRAVLAYCLGVPLDMFQRIEISTASVSVVLVGEGGPWVLCVNALGDLGELAAAEAAPAWKAR